jgi:hypothetical protein
MREEFYGKNYPVRWVGVIEDNRDPSQLGRCKIRIIGWYSDDKNLVPTEALPWAQAQFSPGSKSFSVPKIGEWATGYFLDGNMAQQPVYDGILPGINLTVPIVDKSIRAPEPPPGVTLEQNDTPSSNRLARGELEGSLTDRSNQRRAHVCDETLGIRIRAGFARLQNSQLVTAIRRAIKSLIRLLNFGDSSGVITWITNQLKKIAGAIKYIVDLINEILDFVNLVKLIVRTIRAIIDYILGLPAKLFRFLRECISVVLGAVVSGISDLFSGLGPENLPRDPGIDELFKQGREVLEASKELVEKTTELVFAPATILAAALEPTTAAEQEAAINGFLALTGTASSAAEIETKVIDSVTTLLDSTSTDNETTVAENNFNFGAAKYGA